MLQEKEKILLYGSNLWYLGEGMLGPLFAIFTERIGGDVLDITWAWAAFLAVNGVLMIIFGKISDHVNKALMMVWGYGLFALFTFGYLFIKTPFELLLLQVGLGFASAMATPTWNALYDQYSKSKYDGYTWGIADGQASIVTAIAMVIGGLIVAHYSFEVLFITMGILQVIATIYQARILKVHRKIRKS